MLKNKKALLLDMNSTFMFGEDRFGESQDFSVYYHDIGGQLTKTEVTQIIRSTYDYLDEIYPGEAYRHCFPSVEETIEKVSNPALSQHEIQQIVDTFAFHERGYIPVEYTDALHELSRYFQLSVVIDIWAPKKGWLDVFDKSGVSALFSVASFSSDHGMVKPSPMPFEMVVSQLGIDKSEALVVGDSVRRDLGGAVAAGIDCVLVGGACDPAASDSFTDLLKFTDYCRQELGSESLQSE